MVEMGTCQTVESGYTLKGFENMYGFSVHTPRRKYFLLAKRDEEMRKWVDVICESCGFTPAPPMAYASSGSQDYHYNLHYMYHEARRSKLSRSAEHLVSGVSPQSSPGNAAASLPDSLRYECNITSSSPYETLDETLDNVNDSLRDDVYGSRSSTNSASIYGSSVDANQLHDRNPGPGSIYGSGKMSETYGATSDDTGTYGFVGGLCEADSGIDNLKQRNEHYRNLPQSSDILVPSSTSANPEPANHSPRSSFLDPSTPPAIDRSAKPQAAFDRVQRQSSGGASRKPPKLNLQKQKLVDKNVFSNYSKLF